MLLRMTQLSTVDDFQFYFSSNTAMNLIISPMLMILGILHIDHGFFVQGIPRENQGTEHFTVVWLITVSERPYYLRK